MLLALFVISAFTWLYAAASSAAGGLDDQSFSTGLPGSVRSIEASTTGSSLLSTANNNLGNAIIHGLNAGLSVITSATSSIPKINTISGPPTGISSAQTAVVTVVQLSSSSPTMSSDVSQGSVSKDVQDTSISPKVTVSATYPGTIRSTLGTQTDIRGTTHIEWDAVPSDCQAAKVWYDEATISILQKTPSTTFWLRTYTHSENVTYGTADVYTTIDGIPYARGNLSVSSISRSVSLSQYLSPSSMMAGPTTITSAPLPQSPVCTIPTAACNAMYWNYYDSLSKSYLSTHGNATIQWPTAIPEPLPPPSTSPRCTAPCSEGNNNEQQYITGCTIYGDSVKVYYWPTETNSPTNTITAAPRTAVADGITMTSPSIYLSFNTLWAGDEDHPNLCGSANEGWSPLRRPVGADFADHVISLLPGSVSTLEVAYNSSISGAATPFPDTAMTALLGSNVYDYLYWRSIIRYNQDIWVTSSLNITHLTQPDARAYYLRPSASLQGCYTTVSPLYCNTIFKDNYRAQLGEYSTRHQVNAANTSHSCSTANPRPGSGLVTMLTSTEWNIRPAHCSHCYRRRGCPDYRHYDTTSDQ